MPLIKKTCAHCKQDKPVTLFEGGYCVDCMAVARYKQQEQESRERVERIKNKDDPAAMRAIRQSKAKVDVEPHLGPKPGEPDLNDEQKQERNKKKLAAQKLLASRELARRRLLPFVQYFNDDYMPGWVHEDIAAKLEQFAQDVQDKKSPRLMLFLPPRHGKQLADSTPVLTTKGWKTHGELTVDDYVFHPSGKPVRVLAVSDKTQSDYLVELTNGDIIRCHGNHEWTVYDRAYKTYKTKETKWFTAETKFGKQRQVTSGNRCMYQLPDTESLQFEKREQTVPPYSLGAWLGDGSRGKGCITHDAKDSAVIERMKQDGYEVTSVCEHSETKALTTYFSGPRPGVIGEFPKGLRNIGVYQDKFIPEEYIYASVEQRLELLAGLIDTDGHVCQKTGRVRFTSADKKLADGVYELCMTLGFRPYVTVKQPKLSSSGIQGRKEYYVVGFQPTLNIPTALVRKQCNVQAVRRKYGIKSVTYSPNGEQGHCIQVDSEDGLYLAGKNLTPTHNSELASKTFPAWYLGHNPKDEIIATSYSAELAMDFSRKVRGLLKDPEYRHIFPTQLDPTSQSAERWNTTQGGGYVAAGVGGGITGRGAHCVYFACECTTPNGKVPISQIKVGDKVLGYDHKTKQEKWATVQAVSAGRKKDLLRFGTLRVTKEHRLWTEENGYVYADNADGLTPKMQQVRKGVSTKHKRDTSQFQTVWARNDFLLQSDMRQSTSETQNDVSLRGTQSKSCESMHEMPFERYLCPNGMYRMQSNIQTAQNRTRPKCQPSWFECENILHSEMLFNIPSQEPENFSGYRQAMCYLQPSSAWRPEKILLTAMLPATQSTEGGILWAMVSFETGSEETRQGMRQLWKNKKRNARPPHQPRFDGQPDEEFSAYVPTLPQPLSSTMYGVCANDIEGALPKIIDAEYVVDIQTETGNFYCEERLIHNCAIIDDPIKNREDAESATGRQKIKDWYTSTLYTRLAPGGGVLVILTRWHDDDLAGWLLEQEKEGADEWQVVKYPAIAEEDEPHRQKGEPLHVERYPLEALDKIRNAIGPRDWSALYQQDPVPDTGSYFKTDWFKYYTTADRPPLEELRIYQAWDFAIGQDETNDWTVGITLGVDRDGNSYILNTVRGHWDSFEIVEQILEQARMWKPALVGGEAGQIEMAIGPLLKKRMRETKTYFPLERLKTGRRDKQLRARPLQGRMQQGLVLLPANTTWALTLQNEMLRFPAGTHDDQVDALAWCFQMLESFSYVVKPKQKPKKSWKDQLGKYTKSGTRGSHMTA